MIYNQRPPHNLKPTGVHVQTCAPRSCESKRHGASASDPDLLSYPRLCHPAAQREEEQWLLSALRFQSQRETTKCRRARAGRRRDEGEGEARRPAVGVNKCKKRDEELKLESLRT